MDKLIAIVEVAITEAIPFVLRIVQAICRPRTFLRQYAPTARETAYCIVYSAIVTSALSFFALRAVPAAVLTDDWVVALWPTSERRDFFQNPSTWFGTRGLLLQVAIIAFGTLFVAGLIALWRRDFSVGSVQRYFSRIIYMNCAIAILGSCVSLLMTWALMTPWAPPPIVAFVAIVLWMVMWYCSAIGFITVKRAGELSALKTIGVLLTALLIAIPLSTFLNPVDTYARFFLNARSNERIYSSLSEIGRLGSGDDVPRAAQLAAALYAEYPNDLRVAPVALRAHVLLFEMMREMYLTEGKPSPEHKKTVRAFTKIMRDMLDSVAKGFPDVAAIQIVVAQSAFSTGECGRARIAYETALHVSNALPIERYIAARNFRTMGGDVDDRETKRLLDDFADDGYFARMRSLMPLGLVPLVHSVRLPRVESAWIFPQELRDICEQRARNISKYLRE